ncbi:tetratricopeptide repeat protein [Pantoea sp. 1.19]|uniref:tetratricopeptide repeat protein n=1 Tax=Pantoea sp. 1.19 TaxID=1925589 RepID=UPI000B04EEE6|nr:tetratricopeptide repeat protein [Pantoea sp. 1.19]
MKLGWIGLLLLVSVPAFAQPSLSDIQHRWATCQYRTPEKLKADCLQTLSGEADSASAAAPSRVDMLIWSAIVKSSWAGAKGGLGALSLVKDAKARLELALRLNANALDGSALTSLGALYYQVPGWPIGFGDKKQAEQLLKKALVMNPNGIDPNFFYGDFLLEEGRKQEAKTYLQKAQAAAPRPGREDADRGRQQEIASRLAQL